MEYGLQLFQKSNQRNPMIEKEEEAHHSSRMHEEEYHIKTVNMSQWRENDGKYRRSGGKRLYYGKWK